MRCPSNTEPTSRSVPFRRSTCTAGAVSSNFETRYRYTGAALTSDLAWLIGAAFAPVVALGLSAHFGLGYVSVYLLSGAVCTLAALSVNRVMEMRE